jgi:hypothetical protein
MSYVHNRSCGLAYTQGHIRQPRPATAAHALTIEYLAGRCFAHGQGSDPVISAARRSVVPDQPKAVIVMLPGGTGEIGLTPGGDIRRDNNFAVRTRELWADRGYAVSIPDTIDRENLRGLRSSPGYAPLVDGLISFAHDHIATAVFLLGTSQGSIAAMNGAAHAAPRVLTGLILTESVSVMGGSHETVFDAAPEDVRVPALVIANRDDRCDVAPSDLAPKIAAAMTSAPDVKVSTVSEGISKSSSECGSLTPHGYYGIETEIAILISAWIQDHIK